jgi:hypothetical protein
MDREGAVRIEPRFADGFPFAEGLAAVQVRGKWGYIDEAGNEIIAPKLRNGARFSGGRASILKKGRRVY